MESQKTETLEELIRVCLEGGLIESCERDEAGWFWVAEGPITYCLEADQVRRLLESLLRSRELASRSRPSGSRRKS